MVKVDIPLCIECRHCISIATENSYELAYSCQAMKGLPNPINGQPIVNTDCGWMRIGCDCGREGKLFEPKGGQQ